MTRVLLADDHVMVRTGLESLVNGAEGLEVVATAGDGEEAVALALEHRPDVVVMDLSMPKLNGVEATRRISAQAPEIHIVVLTSFSDREQIVAALDAGAVGYLLKDAEPDELLWGIRAAARGESPLTPRAASTLLSDGTKRGPQLTDREREVLTLVGKGLANKQIARRLGISEKTVKAHLTSVFSQIGVSDRTQAALWAKEHGIV